jgi:hypothetical protein
MTFRERALQSGLRPEAWLGLALLAWLVWMASHGSLVLERTPDSATYLEVLGRDGLPARLSHFRTLLFPALLAAVRVASPDFSWLPTIHALLFAGAVATFFAGLRRFGLGPWHALAVTVPLLASRGAVESIPWMMSEALSASLAVLAVSALLAAVSTPRSAWPWVGVGLATFLACQARPATLFLVPLVPMLAPALVWLRGRPPVSVGVNLWVVGAGLAATALPLLAFCTLRAAVVGDFGLVSFGGMNLVGITGSLLTEASVVDLPTNLQSFGHDVLVERAARGLTWPWDERGELHPEPSTESYGHMIWDVALPAAEARLGPIDQHAVAINHLLQRFNAAVIRAKPRAYARVVAAAYTHGVRRFRDFAHPGLKLADLLVPLVAFLASLVATPRRRFGIPQRAVPERCAHPGVAVVLVATLFFATCLGVVVLVEPPTDRYVHQATLLLGPALAAAIWGAFEALAYVARAAGAFRVLAESRPLRRQEFVSKDWKDEAMPLSLLREAGGAEKR